MPWVFAAMGLAAGAVFVGHESNSVANGVLVILTASPIALGYAVWGFSNERHGLVRTPKTPWLVSLRGESVYIDAQGLVVEIPVADIAKSKLVVDMGLEALRGVEDSTLVLYLKPRFRIYIPGSSVGFQSVLDYVRRGTSHERREVS